jgi:NADH dehydrogenase
LNAGALARRAACSCENAFGIVIARGNSLFKEPVWPSLWVMQKSVACGRYAERRAPRVDRSTKIVILGGGFAGVSAALHLERAMSRQRNIEIVLISDENFMVFTPMLPEVPSSSIEAKHIVSPLRAFFRKVQVQNRTVQAVDLEKRVIVAAHCPVCEPSELRFDHLVLALGSRTHTYGVPGIAVHAFPMKSINDAMILRNHIIDVFEHADLQDDPKERANLLTFVVAGGGFAGVETVAELKDFSLQAPGFYRNLRPEDVKVVLVHAGPRILPEIDESLADYALKKLQEKGVEVRLNTRVGGATGEYVELATGERIPTRTLIWTAGIVAHPLLSALPCPKTKQGKVLVNEYLEVPECPGVWALGDCAAVPDGETGRFYPPTAQHAVRQGVVVAQNVVAELRGGGKRRFSYRALGVLACLGRRSAVAQIWRFRFSGFFAWWLWRTIYLLKLPGLERKLRVAMDWTLDLFFRRDTVLLKVFGSRGFEQIQRAPENRPSHVPTDVDPLLNSYAGESSGVVDRRP